MNGYFLIGERLGHSFSPALHRAFGRYDYALRELSASELGPFLAARAFAGLNVTIPYKQAVIPYLDRLDERAAAVGAVNTVVNRGGVLWGYNTDFGGLEATVRRLRAQSPEPESGAQPLKGMTVLVLGTGGAAKTAQAVSRTLGAAEIRPVSRTGREGALTYGQAKAECRDADFLINCTPVGMYPDLDGFPVDPADFPSLRGAVDCVYNPLRTRLVLRSRALGIPAAGGLEMLVRQAALSCELFTGSPVEEERVGVILNDLRRDRENLVLIGMPGAGKTTLGRLLAQKTGKEFVDLDEAIEKRAGKTVRALFAERGEAYFRELEAELVRETARTGGKIIAAGGGTVLRPENVLRLKQNGRLILLDRPPEALKPSPERPLGDTTEKLRALYALRRPIYAAAADCTVGVTGTPEDAAQAILQKTEGTER